METKDALVDWTYSGKPDLSAGTGATQIEKALPLVGSLLLTAWVIASGLRASEAWAVWQWALALFIAFDVGGGVVANSLNSCKRFYHSSLKPEETGFVAVAKNHTLFAGLHVHTVLAFAAWDMVHLWIGALWYVMLLASAAVVLRTPLYLARPVSVLLVSAATVLNTTLPTIDGLEWLVPLLFLKIVLGHAVREEPYRPTS